MKDDIKKLIDETINKHKIITEESIPTIDLYMDQVTTFIEDNLSIKDGETKEKLLTKTMINNYTKAGLIPPPVKKKYSKEHLIMLIYIYYYKSFISINEAKEILTPLKDNNFTEDGPDSLSTIYRRTCDFYDTIKDSITDDINKKINIIETEEQKNEELGSSDYRQLFALFNMLSYDIFIKKHIMEEIISKLDTLV